MKLAFLYAGQGSQKVGMGRDLYETYPAFKKVIDQIQLPFDVKKLMFEGPEEQLSQTKYTQPCMAAFAAGVTAVLKENNIVPQLMAGLSLGEYSALYAAGVFDVDTFLSLVAFRGKVMEEASKGVDCKMSAVLGVDREVLKHVCVSASKEGIVEISNYNCTGQYVIAGEGKAVEQAEKLAIEAGAKRCMPLKVSGPFHTSFMKPAAEALEDYLKTVTFHRMNCPVVFNRTARVLQPEETVAALLVEQVQHSIYMEDTLNYFAENGIDTVIEIGPGKVLSGFIRRTVPAMKAYSIETAAGMQQILEKKEEFL